MGLEANLFDFKFESERENRTSSKVLLNPFLSVLYRVNTIKQVSFNYSKSIQLPSIYQLDNFTKVQSYTSIIVGNPQLKNTVNHNFSVRYADFNIPKNYSFQSTQSLTINDKGFATAYEFNDINNIASYFVQENAGLVCQSRNSFFYLFNTWELGMRINYNVRKENILISNTETSQNNRLNLSPRIKTDFKSTPNIAFSPFWSFNNQRFGNTERSFTSNGFQSKLDYNFSTRWYSFINYNYSDINGKKAFDSLDFELRFTNKIKSMDISIMGANALSNRISKNLIFNQLFQMATINESLGGRVLLKCSYYF